MKFDREKINPKMRDKECWINVYKTGLASPLNQLSAYIESYNMKKIFGLKTLYRIHVKLK